MAAAWLPWAKADTRFTACFASGCVKALLPAACQSTLAPLAAADLSRSFAAGPISFAIWAPPPAAAAAATVAANKPTAFVIPGFEICCG